MACAGDCNADGTVTPDELLAEMSIALGYDDGSVCLPHDSPLEGTMPVDRIIAAVNNLVGGCPRP